MQTKINETLALGIPGEFVNTNLRRVDSYSVGKEVKLGGMAFLKGDVAYPDTTDSATLVKGIFVSTHQHIAANGPTDAYRPTLAVAAGNEIGVATMGDIFVDVTLGTSTVTTVAGAGETEDAAIADAKAKALTAINALGVKRGQTLYYSDAGAITDVSTSNTALGTVVLASSEGLSFVEEDLDSLITVTGGGAGTSRTASVAVKSGVSFTVTAGVRIG